MSPDQNPRRKQIFSKGLVETKRLGRTLPAIINGMTASQALAHGFLEEGSYSETILTANNESLFIEEDFEFEEHDSRPKSASPAEKDHRNGAATKLNSAATSFDAFLTSTSSPAITLGKPSANSSSTEGLKEPNLPSSLPSASIAHPVSNSQRNPGPSRFEFFASKDSKEGAGWANTPTSKVGDESPGSKLIAIGEPFDVTELGTNRKTSPSLDQSDTKSTAFVQSPGATSLSLPDPKTVAIKSATSTNDAPYSAQISIFNQPPQELGPPRISFGISPLFKSSPADQTSKIDVGHPVLSSLNKVADQSCLSSDVSISSNSPSASFPPSKPTIDPSSAPSEKASVTFAPSNPRDSKAISLIPDESRSRIASFSSSEPIKEEFFRPAITSFLPRAQQGSSSIKSNAKDRYRIDAPTILHQAPSCSTTSYRSPSISFQAADDSQPSLGPSRRDLLIGRGGKLDSVSLSLDRLSDAMMQEENGLLQQFIEFTVEPIIRSSLVQLVDDQSWEAAS